MRVPDDLLVHLRRARDLIDRDDAEPLDLDALAATAGVSKHHVLHWAPASARALRRRSPPTMRP